MSTNKELEQVIMGMSADLLAGKGTVTIKEQDGAYIFMDKDTLVSLNENELKGLEFFINLIVLYRGAEQKEITSQGSGTDHTGPK